MAKFDHADFDKNNRRTYSARRVVRQFQTATGWLEPGEQAAFALISEQVRDGAILDVGVGGGRTAPLMLAISADYRGIDYCATMVDVARSRFPHLRFLAMDAGRLTFADSSFDLAAFSYNGIDSVNLAGRQEVLHNVYRVLRPGGYFVFSALNRQGSAHDDHWPDFGVFREVGWSPNRALQAAGRFMLGGANWLRLHHFARDDEEMAIGTISAHSFGLLTLFTSLKAQLQQLADSGFHVEAVFEPEGRRLAADGSEASNAPWYHFVARKPISEP
jgi:ubiquinone/menaquinone biosynthesis C-methylase UbiE